MDFTGSLNKMVDSFIAWLPNLVGVLAILIIGYIVALILKMVTTGGLNKIGFKRRIDRSSAQNLVNRITSNPSETVGKFVFWLIIIITITIAISAMNVPVLNQLITGVYGYVPNILAAILILGASLAIAGAVSAIIHRLMGDTVTGKILSSVLPVIILSIAGFAILVQLKIAPPIVIITYTAIVGSLALGFALAFGLGGVEVSRRLFDQAYNLGKQNMGQIRQDFQKGKEKGKREAKDIKKDIEEEK